MSEALDPNDFIITRKRKKYRFALFSNNSLCFEHEKWDKTFRPNVAELGAGTGLFSVDLAAGDPDRNYVAIDIKGDRLQKGAYKAEEQKLENLRFLRSRADQLMEVLDPNSLDELWMTFSDPFPKKSSAGRRMTHENYLKKYAAILKPAGSIYIKHDNYEFFCWSLEQLVINGWTIQELSFDLHESTLDERYKTMTSYEERWLREGRITKFVKATPKKETE